MQEVTSSSLVSPTIVERVLGEVFPGALFLSVAQVLQRVTPLYSDVFRPRAAGAGPGFLLPGHGRATGGSCRALVGWTIRGKGSTEVLRRGAARLRFLPLGRRWRCSAAGRGNGLDRASSIVEILSNVVDEGRSSIGREESVSV